MKIRVGLPNNSLDFETYCDLDIRKVGLDVYMSHPSFTVLCGGIVTSVGAKIPLDFITDYRASLNTLYELINAQTVVAHNAQFEVGCVQRLLGAYAHENTHWIDTAVTSRAHGGSSSLERAARQFLDPADAKMPDGKRLIKLFSVPNSQNGFRAPDADMIKDHPNDWKLFIEYSIQDAKVAQLLDQRLPKLRLNAAAQETLTIEMNQAGWPVDMETVDRMALMYASNTAELEAEFKKKHDPNDQLNLTSVQQLGAWAKERGVRIPSFNVQTVEEYLPLVTAKLSTMEYDHPRYGDYLAVRDLLEVKQALGGTALKKLDVIKRQTNEDGRLRNQYIHVGASQTHRTTGGGVQMQNLKRLNPATMIDDMSRLETEVFDNTTLGENLRQVFAAPVGGSIIVGDFSSIESRGLAWIAGADWKIQAFRDGKDMYKVAASGIFGVPYDEVTKQQRQTGKVAELSCGYQGSKNAVDRFSDIYRLPISDEQKVKLVKDWRKTNPEIVALWAKLDEVLAAVMAFTSLEEFGYMPLANNLFIRYELVDTPASIPKQSAKSFILSLVHDHGPNESVIMTRTFHGAYYRGRDIVIHKPRERVTGDVWEDHYEFEGRKIYHTIYGGKLAGILTQSFCREAFFDVGAELRDFIAHTKNLLLIGQFHDEYGVEWSGTRTFRSEGEVWGLESARSKIEEIMSDPPEWLQGFPMEAEVNQAQRYIK